MVVLEVCLGGLSGYEVCRELRDEFGDALPVVFVSAERAESHDRVAGFLVGGDDFLVKPFAVDEFVARVRRLLERAEGRTAFESALTPRELEVLSLVAEGLPRNDIARRLFISPKTVGTHIERIFRKLACAGGRVRLPARPLRRARRDERRPLTREGRPRRTAPRRVV